jgi:hypothetical protein
MIAIDRFDTLAPPPPSGDWLLDLVRSEYLEMPGLNLTKAQMERMWSVDPTTCERVLDTLVASHFLECTAHGHYVLARE